MKIELDIPDEVVAAVGVIANLVKDVKAGASPLTVVGDALKGLVDASAGMSQLGADIKKPEVRAYLAYALECDVEAVVAQAAAVPAPAAP